MCRQVYKNVPTDDVILSQTCDQLIQKYFEKKFFILGDNYTSK